MQLYGYSPFKNHTIYHAIICRHCRYSHSLFKNVPFTKQLYVDTADTAILYLKHPYYYEIICRHCRYSNSLFKIVPFTMQLYVDTADTAILYLKTCLLLCNYMQTLPIQQFFNVVVNYQSSKGTKSLFKIAITLSNLNKDFSPEL